ncbi:MAG: AGE family epimerase/isomerase [Verrucomicrobia bacterium]|nr:AGE family epimerase/isomerase [Verrucomicrobiota bacterium]
MTPTRRAELIQTYRDGLLLDVLPFWLRHGWDRQHGGVITGLDRVGRIVETDKAMWFQGRAAWMYATTYLTVERRPEWLEFAASCLDFIRRHGRAADGKMYFTVTREGRPLRMRRYVYSECFAAIAFAAHAKATGDARSAEDAAAAWATYLHHTFTPGVMPPKTDPATRPMQGVAPRMITMVTAQELRAHLGEVRVGGATCTEWIDRAIGEIERYFLKPDLQVLLEVAGPNGEFLDHFDGRQLNPGHAIEAAWFILHEAKHRGRDPRLVRLGTTILDWMWARGWDSAHGGMLYHIDALGRPLQEYWHDMKFWWPHNETIIATLLAWQLTGDAKYLDWHRQVHDWAYAHFPDREHGEWYGYLHRDGTVSTQLKGGTWKGPFHLPRMQWYSWQLLAEPG